MAKVGVGSGALCAVLLACGRTTQPGDASLGEFGGASSSGGAAATPGGSGRGGRSAGQGGESTGRGGRSAGQGGGSTGRGGSPGSGLEPGGTGAAAAEDAFCPSLGLPPGEPLFTAQQGRERTLIRADGSVLFRHTLSFDGSADSVFADGQTLVFAATLLRGSGGEHPWEIVRIDREGYLLASATGSLPDTTAQQAYAPRAVGPRGERIAFEMNNADTLLAGFDGASELLECEQRTSLGPAEGVGWIGAELKLSFGSMPALVNESSGECLRVPDPVGSSDTTFLHGRFQYARQAEFLAQLFDVGPETGGHSAMLPPSPVNSKIRLLAASEDVLYVLTGSRLTRYDVVARETREVALVGADAVEVHGHRVVAFAGALPRSSFDVRTETLTPIDPETSPGVASSRTSEDHVLVSIDERPALWISLETGEQRPFEIPVPEAALEFIESGSAGLVIADGLPAAHFDVAAGVAREIVLARSGNAETITDDSRALVVLDGVPAFHVDLEDGEVREIVGGEIASVASTERVGAHVVVLSNGVPSALLDREAGVLIPLSSAADVARATRMIANERYIVGFDQRDWPVFRIDTGSHTLSGYAVSEPSDLVSLRDERYVEERGDATFETYYAPALEANGVVLDDGSVALVLRDARQVRLWSVTPDDTAFQPLGRPFSNVMDLRWTVSRHYFQIAADRGDCFCQPPKLRWEGSPDSDLMPVGAVQVVARAHPALVIVRDNFLVETDASGACLIEPANPALIHDLVLGSTQALAGVDGTLTFLPGAARLSDHD